MIEPKYRERNAEIVREYENHTAKEIANKYGISVGRVYGIVKEHKLRQERDDSRASSKLYNEFVAIAEQMGYETAQAITRAYNLLLMAAGMRGEITEEAIAEMRNCGEKSRPLILETVRRIKACELSSQAIEEWRLIQAENQRIRERIEKPYNSFMSENCLQKCASCGAKFSDAYRMCPKCGKPTAKCMKPEIVNAWAGGDESACPHCKHEHDYERREEDDGYDAEGHWIAFLFECNKCGGKWWASYYLRDAKLEAVE